MANIDVTQDAELTSNTAPALADRLLLVKASNSSLTDITPDQLMKIINLLTEDTTPAIGDFVVTYDASASAAKKVALGSSSVWTAFTPSWTNVTVGDGTNAGVYTHIGKSTAFYASFTFGTTSAVGTDPLLALPATAVSMSASTPIAQVVLNDSGGSTYQGMGIVASTTSLLIRVLVASGTYLTHGQITATVPFTWATGDQILITGFYDRA
jgi:hypothetical protein